ncbi:MAG: hypothetical protein J6O62_01565 [Bacilli bacterium]|nr:hypothetical protein [Bacilli bacterium]
MFKKKVGRPSNAYKRRVRNFKLFGIAAIITLLGTTIYSLSDYIQGNTNILGANINWRSGSYVYSCPDGWERHGDKMCRKYENPKSSKTCQYRLNGDSSYIGYEWSDVKQTCIKKVSVVKENYPECPKYSDTVSYYISSTGMCRYYGTNLHLISDTCNLIKGMLENVNGRKSCLKYVGKPTYDSCPGTSEFYNHDGMWCVETKEPATYYYCGDDRENEYHVTTADSKCIVSDKLADHGTLDTSTQQVYSQCESACSNNSSVSNDTEKTHCVSDCVNGCRGSSNTISCAEKYKTKEINVEEPVVNYGPVGDGSSIDDNNTNDSGEIYEQPKVLPELKIINSRKENLTNTERGRNLCTNTPLYISGASTSDVTWKSDKLKISNSIEKTSTDKVIIGPKSEIKLGEKVEVTVTRTEDSKEAKITFINNTDCSSAKVCKSLSKININHGMSIMNDKQIKLLKGGYLGLNLEIYPLNVNYKASNIKWTTSDKSIVEIKEVKGMSKQGIQIYGKKTSKKTVTITATLGNKTQQFKVKVVDKGGFNNPGGYDNASKMVSCTPKTNITKATVEKVKTQKFSGQVIEPKPKVTYNKKTLKEGTDYKITYANNVNPGEARLKISGIGYYSGSKTITFKIEKTSEKAAAQIKVTEKNRNLSDASCFPNPLEFTFEETAGKGIAEVYYSKDKGKKWSALPKDTKTINGNKAAIKISTKHESIMFRVKDKKGNMSKVYGPYKINIQKTCAKEMPKSDTSSQTITKAQTMVITNKKAEKGKFTYTIEDKSTATIDQMYWYSTDTKNWNKYNEWKSTKKADNACYISLCYHKYINSNGIIKIFKITKSDIKEVKLKNISSATINSIPTQNYTGKEVTPNVVVKYSGKVLKKDTAYTVTYSNNVNPGTGVVTITGTGFYNGSKKVNFKIEKINNTPQQQKTANIQINVPSTLTSGTCVTNAQRVIFNETNGVGIKQVQYKSDKSDWKTLASVSNKSEISISLKNPHNQIWFKVTAVNGNVKEFGPYKVNIKSSCTNQSTSSTTQPTPQTKTANITINVPSVLTSGACVTTSQPVIFTETNEVGIKQVQYKSDKTNEWKTLASVKNKKSIGITLKNPHNQIWFKVTAVNGNVKEFGPYKVNIKSSCTAQSQQTSPQPQQSQAQQQVTPQQTSPTQINTIKVSGIDTKSCKKRGVSFTVDSTGDNGASIYKIEFSTDKKTWKTSNSCTITGKKATCKINSKYTSLYYKVTTSHNHYQVFGRYCTK